MTSRRLVAGVDTSTQSVKVVVCDLDSGEVVRSGRADHPAGTEVSAAAWLTAYGEATADPALLEGVAALSVGGQQHGMVTLDDHGELVRDALLWNDNRSAQAALDLIDDLGGPDRWADAVGSVPVASFTAAKLRWLARHEPENAARVAQVILPHDYLTWEIGGRSFDPVTDRGDASGTAYFDATSNTYREDLVELSQPTLNPGETYTDLLADASAYEDFDAASYFNGRGFGFVKVQQLMLEHLMGARG